MGDVRVKGDLLRRTISVGEGQYYQNSFYIYAYVCKIVKNIIIAIHFYMEITNFSVNSIGLSVKYISI